MATLQVKFSIATGAQWGQSKCLQTGATTTVWGDATYEDVTSNTIVRRGDGFVSFVVNGAVTKTLGSASVSTVDAVGWVTFSDSTVVYFVDKLVTSNQNGGAEIIMYCGIRSNKLRDPDFE